MFVVFSVFVVSSVFTVFVVSSVFKVFVVSPVFTVFKASPVQTVSLFLTVLTVSLVSSVLLYFSGLLEFVYPSVFVFFPLFIGLSFSPVFSLFIVSSLF